MRYQPTSASAAAWRSFIALRETMLELRYQRGVTIPGGAEFEATRARARVLDAHRQKLQLGRLAQALEPFDRRDRRGEEILAHAHVIEAELFEAIQIDVVKRDAAAMLLDHREGGTQDVLLAQIQSAREALDEAGLARAQLAGKAEQLAAFEQRPEAPAPSFGLARRV